MSFRPRRRCPNFCPLMSRGSTFCHSLERPKKLGVFRRSWILHSKLASLIKRGNLISLRPSTQPSIWWYIYLYNPDIVNKNHQPLEHLIHQRDILLNSTSKPPLPNPILTSPTKRSGRHPNHPQPTAHSPFNPPLLHKTRTPSISWSSSTKV